MAGIAATTPGEARQMLERLGDQGRVLDVREPWEYARVHLEGALHIPMAEVPGRLEELNSEHTYLVLCHHGSRSAQVTAFLTSRAYKAVNVAGGIDAWAVELDPSLPRY